MSCPTAQKDIFSIYSYQGTPVVGKTAGLLPSSMEDKKIFMQILDAELSFKGSFQVRAKTEKIVIHHSASSIDTRINDVHHWHQSRGWIGIGYHYLIYNNGDIYIGRPEWAVGAHAFQDAAHEANSNGIAICLIGNFEYQKPSEAQIIKLITLIRNIWERYPDLPVIGHKDLMATACPGPKFPWPDLYAKLQKELIVVALEKWMTEGGQTALKELTQKGLVNNPEQWQSEEKMAEAVPLYLFWMMINRISNYKGA
jgi:N-acetyl-anhydromuramyl-L-alanine amidase AmpD